MQPITLRIQSDLLAELESEADEHGYSSRAEYIRQLLQHRNNAQKAITTGEGGQVIDTEVVEKNTDRIDAIATQIDQLTDRLEVLETIVAESAMEEALDTQPVDDTDVEQAMTSTGQATETVMLQAWLITDGPESEAAREIILDAAEILLEDGPLSAGDLKNELYDSHSEAYSSAETLWGSTVDRVYEDAPGFSKPERGVYNFNSIALSSE